MIGVYTATHTSTEMFYIGFTTDFDRRRKQHYRFMKTGSHPNYWMQLNYGFDKAFSWEIIEVASREEGLKLELQKIHEHRDNPALMNFTGLPRSVEVRQKMSHTHTHRWTPELRAEAAEIQARAWTPEKCAKQAEMWTPEKRMAHAAVRIGSTHTPEARKKISMGLKGKPKSPNVAKMVGERSSKKISIDAIVYANLTMAAEKLDISRRTIRNRITSSDEKWRDWRWS